MVCWASVDGADCTTHGELAFYSGLRRCIRLAVVRRLVVMVCYVTDAGDVTDADEVAVVGDGLD